MTPPRQTPPVQDAAAVERLRRFGGEVLVAEVAASVRRTLPEGLEAVRDGLAAGDTMAVRRASHILVSASLNLGGEETLEAARALEAAARDSRVDALPALAEALEDAAVRFDAALADLAKGSA